MIVETTTVELAMKVMTFMGVALAAALVSARHASLRALLRDAALGAMGVALMLGNARLRAGALGLAVDAAYLGICSAALTQHVRSARRARRSASLEASATTAPGTPAR